MKITLHPEAEVDIAEAAAFHERQGSTALAARFIAEFKRAATLLLEHPESALRGPRVACSFRCESFPTE